MANLTFNGYDLATYGIEISGHVGLYDIASPVTARAFVPGSSVPHDVLQRREVVPITIPCILLADTHAATLAMRDALVPILRPEAGWCWLTVTSMPGWRTLAMCKGFPVDVPELPFLRKHILFSLAFDRLPWFEEVNARVVTVSTATGSITNSGTEPTPALFECLVTDTLASGLSFTVGTQTFLYTGALAAADVLAVTSEGDLPSVKKNGVLDFAHTSLTADFPTLAVGVNAVTLSDHTKFSLRTTFRYRKG